MKKTLLVVVAGLLLFAACDSGLQVVDMPASVEAMDFREYDGDIDPSTLPSFTGNAVSQSDIETLFDPDSPAMAMNVIPAVVESVEQAVFPYSNRSVGAYAVFAFNVADETVVLEDELGNPVITVSVDELNALWSASAEIDQISDEIESFFMDEMIDALGTLGADYTAQLKVNADVQMDTEFTETPVSYAAWHHLSNFVIDAGNVVVTFDSASDEPTVTGNIAIRMVFSTSFGFVISGAESMNGRYVVNISMEPIDAEADITTIQSTIEAHTGPESTEEDLVNALVELFANGRDLSELFRLEYAAYNNDGSEIAYVRMPLADAIMLLMYMGF